VDIGDAWIMGMFPIYTFLSNGREERINKVWVIVVARAITHQKLATIKVILSYFL